MKALKWMFVAVLFGVGFTVFFVYREPTTTLIDAAGERLTAGVDEGAEVFAGDVFDEARALMEAGDYAAAEANLVQLVNESERDGEACILLSEVARELEKADDAADFGLKAVELLPESAEAHLVYAQAIGAQMMSGGGGLAALASMTPRLKRMKEECTRVIELNSDDTEARTILAMTFLMLPRLMGGDQEKALELCREVEARDAIGGKQLLAMALYQTGAKDDAIELCRAALVEYPDERGFHVTLGGFHAEEKHFEEADAAYKAARAGDQDEHYYLALYMQARMRVENEFESTEAITMLEEFIAAEPEGEFIPSVAHALWRKGVAHELAGDRALAEGCYEESLRRDPGFDKAEGALAVLRKGAAE